MHCFRSKWKQHEHNAVFRLYIAKGMQIAVKAFAGIEMTGYEDLIGMETYHDTRSAEEIAADVIKNAGLEVAMDGSV